MAIGTPGTWGSWYGFGPKLPDFGITEGLFGGQTTNPLVINPAVQQYMSPSAMQPAIQPPTTPPPSGSPRTSAPAPQTQQPSGRDPHINPATGLWDDNYFAANQPKSPWSSAPQGPSPEDLNAIYQPAQDTLSAQEAAFRAEQPLAEAKVGTSYQEGLSLLDKNLAEQEAALGKQGQKISTAKANALGQARQLFSELSQKYGAMFGSRSSAGPAAMELLSRETQRQFGGIESQSTEAQQDVESEGRRLVSWVSDQKNVMLQKRNDAMGEIQRTFTTGLAQIQAQRGQLESAKAAARVDLLNQTRRDAQQVEAASTQYNRQIEMFQQQQKAELEKMQYARQLSGFTGKPFDPSQIGPASSAGTGSTVANSDYKQGQLWDPVTNRWVWPS